MLEKRREKKVSLKCPHCQHEQHIGDFSWMGIFDDLDRFDKTVMCCTNCRRWYVILEDDEIVIY